MREEEVFPRPLREFVRLFNRGDFWESHEVLEDAWRRTDSSFYHGLILYASAFVHLGRRNAHGVRAQLAKTLRALEGLPDAYLGIDVAAIREGARRRREKAGGDGGEPPEGWAVPSPCPASSSIRPGFGATSRKERQPGVGEERPRAPGRGRPRPRPRSSRDRRRGPGDQKISSRM